jgi:hypothetical protein
VRAEFERREPWETRAPATRAGIAPPDAAPHGLTARRGCAAYCEGCGTVQLIFGLAPT